MPPASSKRWAEADWQEGGWDEAGAEEPAEAEPEAAPQAAPSAPKKRRVRLRPKPEQLEPGSTVLYWDGQRGYIRDAYVPINEFWVADEQSGKLVRDSQDKIVAFKAHDLELVAGPPVLPPPSSGQLARAGGGVLLIGAEEFMETILKHFGAPNATERQQPQQLLAIPCDYCDPESLLAVARDGVEASIFEVAESLRPDVHVALRSFHLKQAIESLGEGLQRMAGYYVMGSITVPYGMNEFKSLQTGSWERRWRKDICNQVDLCVTAHGFHEDGDRGSVATARRVLGETCGVTLSSQLWNQQVQLSIRRELGVELPLEFVDANNVRVFVLLLPSDALASEKGGILTFYEGEEATYVVSDEALAADLKAGDEEEEERQAATGAAPSKPAKAPAGPSTAASSNEQVQGRSIEDWQRTQAADFPGLEPLPPKWLRIRSRTTQEIYYYNRETQKSTFQAPEWPLPEGWTQQVSKSTGKTYYFHAGKRLSQFDRPRE